MEQARTEPNWQADWQGLADAAREQDRQWEFQWAQEQAQVRRNMAAIENGTFGDPTYKGMECGWGESDWRTRSRGLLGLAAFFIVPTILIALFFWVDASMKGY